MENISCKADLLDAIQLLEEKQAINLKVMREDFHQAYESLKPANLIRNTIKNISTSHYLSDNLLSAGIGLAAGYVSKKAVFGGSSNVFKRFFGAILQFGVTNIIAQNPETVKSFTEYISHHIFQKEE
ncbi:MAG TPA: hypothetical protein DG754_07395 [Bacteroidales bacterium]|jgi:hypothetical protein|nr:hypothetical protein [Bacteroidales bacterium]